MRLQNVIFFMVGVVFLIVIINDAALAAPTDNDWWTIASLVNKNWVAKIGAIILFVGGAIFGLGWGKKVK